MNDTMNECTARIIGGIYFAICAGLSDDQAASANAILRDFANNPKINPCDRAIYRLIAESSIVKEAERPRPKLELIAGGVA
jgi:hypothetical protein